MNRGKHALRVTGLVLAGSMMLGPAASAQEDWYPSKYGADDEIGAANLLSPPRRCSRPPS